MIEILSATVPIFLVVAVGWAVTRAGVLRREDMSVLATFVVKVALPLLVFVNVSGRSAAEVFNPTYLLTYALAALTMFGVAFAWGAALRRSRHRSTFMGMAMAGTNNGFVGFAIFLIVVPDVAGIAVGMDMIVDNVVIIPLTLLLAEHFARSGGGLAGRLLRTARQVVTHPMVIAIIAALLLNAVGLTLPPMLDRGVRLLAQASSGVALFAVGGMLVGLQIRGMLSDVAANVVGKLLVMPAVGLGVLWLLEAAGLPPLAGPLRAAVILTCALPPFTVLPSIALAYGEEEVATASVMVATVASFVTLTTWLWLVTQWGWL